MAAGPGCLLLIQLVVYLGTARAPDPEQDMLASVNKWADGLAVELRDLSKDVSRGQQMQESFKSTKVTSREGQKLVFIIAKEIERMMQMKTEAVKAIVKKAEELPLKAKPHSGWPMCEFVDAKRLNLTSFFNNDSTVEVKENSHFFGTKVNTSISAVHVPTNIYYAAPDIYHDIKWSEGLDQVFAENYAKDPSLSWQYFGSSKGFMRRFPASWWEPTPAGLHPTRPTPVDVFDCRTRSWYIEAATSPKDIVILVDNSGSMTGTRRAIAHQVVYTILDTLSSNDYVNILSFNVTTLEVVCCFKNVLVQANLENIRELKLGLERLEKAFNITEFPIALNRAFDLLEKYRFEKRGSTCNQAIMLVTDGAPENFQEIFERWNWHDYPTVPVRMFTYLVGEDANLNEMQWMACNNRGYFVHINVMTQVRELVLRYVSVMARPIVLNVTHHPVVWTPAYADIVDPKMTDWLWNLKERELQKVLSWKIRQSYTYKLWKMGNFTEERRNFLGFKRKRIKKIDEVAAEAIKDSDLRDAQDYIVRSVDVKRYPYKIMTAVSMPVYDLTENGTRDAIILGVAGTDVPNYEIQRLMIPHMLGVGAYAFIVTNNGYILIHPELRPEFQVSINNTIITILKPNYNNVDFTDVELIYENETSKVEEKEDPVKKKLDEECSKQETFIINEKRPIVMVPCRKDDPAQLTLRDDLINQANGSATMLVKFQYDDFRRVSFGKRHYYFTFINGTPFELIVALPDIYGLNKVEAKLEIKPSSHPKGKKITDFLKGQNWKIHPNWFYCKYDFNVPYDFTSPEEEIIHFLNRVSQPGFKWPKQQRNSPEHYHCNFCNTYKDSPRKGEFHCDKTLLLSLAYDAKATDWFNQNISSVLGEDKFLKVKNKYGLVLLFMATRSGLTRWQDVSSPFENLESSKEKSGGERNSTDGETKNKTQHFCEAHNYAIDETWYRRAVEQYYVEPDSFLYSVPYGLTEKNETLVTVTQAIFHTEGHREAPAAVVGYQFRHSALYSLFKNITYKCENCLKTCESVAYDCYILDNNGYVVVSELFTDTGKFFGEIQGFVMNKMVEDKVYRTIELYDYQAVCFEYDPQKISEVKLILNRTRPQPCDMRVNLYSLNAKRLKKAISANNCIRPYYAKEIMYSNLIMVVVNSSCTVDKNTTLKVLPEEVIYDNDRCCKSGRVLPRRNVAECTNFNMREEGIINLCGQGTTELPMPIIILIFSIASFVLRKL